MRMPALFIGHGTPMHAVREDRVSRVWTALGAELPKPRVVLCVSAHWETGGAAVTGQERPRTIHDFGGFPAELFAVQYPAPGSAWLVERVQALAPDVAVDTAWGLDHGSWAPLRHVFPLADIPVVQLSLARRLQPDDHVALARRLAGLRDEGVLVVGSGNIVHNLRRIQWGGGEPHDWAERFDARVAALIEENDAAALCHYSDLPDAALAVPTPEHYLPLLYVLGVRHPDDRLQFFNDFIEMGSMSMRSFILHAGGEDYEV